MLARLGLTDEEVGQMQAKLVQVLDYINMLEKIDTSQLPPTAQILSHLNVTRPDEVADSLPVDKVLANAPATEGEFIRVPVVIEEAKPNKGDSGSEGANA